MSPTQSTSGRDGAPKPAGLKWAYYAAIAAAIMLIVSALIMFSTTPPQETDQEVIDAVLKNYRFLGIANIIGGLLVAALAAQFSNAGIVSRRVYLATAAVLIALNLISIMLGIGGIGLMIVVLLLAVSAVLYLIPSVSAYISGNRSV